MTSAEAAYSRAMTAVSRVKLTSEFDGPSLKAALHRLSDLPWLIGEVLPLPKIRYSLLGYWDKPETACSECMEFAAIEIHLAVGYGGFGTRVWSGVWVRL